MSKITANECQNVEYKRSWKDEYLKWICGFAKKITGTGNLIYSHCDEKYERID